MPHVQHVQIVPRVNGHRIALYDVLDNIAYRRSDVRRVGGLSFIAYSRDAQRTLRDNATRFGAFVRVTPYN